MFSLPFCCPSWTDALPVARGRSGSGGQRPGPDRILIAAALAILAQLDTSSPYLLLAGGLLVLGAGMGAAMTPATSAITSALPRAQQGVASAMNNLSREVGGALGIAVLGSIATAVYRSHLSLPFVPAAELDKIKDSFAVAAHLGGPIATQASSAFVDGVHVALLAAAGAAVLAAALVVTLLPRRDTPAAQETAEPADRIPAALAS